MFSCSYLNSKRIATAVWSNDALTEPLSAESNVEYIKIQMLKYFHNPRCFKLRQSYIGTIKIPVIFPRCLSRVLSGQQSSSFQLNFSDSMIRKCFFAIQVAGHWQRLTRDVAQPPSVEVLQSPLDMVLNHSVITKSLKRLR